MATSLLIAAVAAQAASAGCPVAALRGATLEQTQAAWLERFNALDLPCFLRFFAADATLFSPSQVDDRTRRVEPAELPAYWSKMFTRLGEGGRSLAIQPRDVVITRLGPTAAVVSFHLTADASHPGRRTLVWRLERAGWRIAHLHGSRVAPAPAAR
jgi:ketosteroid isomerase-like protein